MNILLQNIVKMYFFVKNYAYIDLKNVAVAIVEVNW